MVDFMSRHACRTVTSPPSAILGKERGVKHRSVTPTGRMGAKRSTLTGKEEIYQNGMEKGSTGPFQGERVPAQFLPDEHNKINQCMQLKYNQGTIIVTGGRMPKDHYGSILTQNR